MSIISQSSSNENRFKFTVDTFLTRTKIDSFLKQSNASKQKGVPCFSVFKFIFLMIFTGKNLFMTLERQAETKEFGKDVVYRFLNSIYINWKRFLLLFSSFVIKNDIENLTDEKRVNVFIVDDSFFGRMRSKSVEMLSWIHDHAEKGKNKFKKGFKMLTLGWSDGNTFIPIAFQLLCSSDPKKRLSQMNESIDKRTAGHKRRMDATKKSPEVMLKMLKEAIDAGVKASYLLFDSWFCHTATLLSVSKLGLNTIAMMKKTKKEHFMFNGKAMDIKQIYQSIRKRRGRSKYLASVLVEVFNNKGECIPAKIVYVRDRTNRKKWLALISTDSTLDEEEIIRIYGKRWNIEVFFKMCKSYLSLAKEFQGRSYDMMVAHTTIVFSRYIMLSVENRNNKDLRTFGPLFYYCCDELQDIKFLEAMQIVIDTFNHTLQEKLFLSKEQVSELIDYFMSCLPTYIKEKLMLCSCES